MEFDGFYLLSSREVCDDVFDKFSICVESEDIESLPQFKLLLSDLCNNVNIDGITKPLQIQMEQAEEKLLDAKQRYFQASIIFSALDEVLTNFELKCLKQAPSPAESKIYSTVRKQLSHGELCKYLSDSGDRQDYLGFTKDFILSNVDPADQKVVKETLIPGIENIIHKQCKSVLLYHGQESQNEMVFTDISHLPSALAFKKQALLEQQRQIFKEKKIINKQVEHYFEYMKDAVKTMKTLIELRQKNIGFQTTMAQFYATKCEALSLKARIFELQILNETYTPETVPALKVIRDNMIKEKIEVEHELEEKTNVLKSYEAVGSTFNSLVEEYTQLMKAIENEKWALDELKRSENTSVL